MAPTDSFRDIAAVAPARQDLHTYCAVAEEIRDGLTRHPTNPEQPTPPANTGDPAGCLAGVLPENTPGYTDHSANQCADSTTTPTTKPAAIDHSDSTEPTTTGPATADPDNTATDTDSAEQAVTDTAPDPAP